MGERVVGVIPSRYGSTRLPGKSLIPLCGKPLVCWVVERALSSRRLDEVIVATDDARIAEAVRPTGARAVMTGVHHRTGTDRIAEAIRGIEASVVVNIQGDEPLIDPGLIDQLAARLLDEKTSWDMTTAVAPLARPDDIANPAVVKVVWDGTGRALYFSRAPIPFIRDPGDPVPASLYWRHLGVYGYRREFLERFVATPPSPAETAEKLEQLRALHIGGRIGIITTREAGIGVDTPEDVPYVESLMRRMNLATQ